MGRGQGPMKGRPHVGPPGEDRPPFNMGPPEWGPPPPRGWGPPPPGGWGPPPPGGWGPAPPEEWGPPHTAGWGPPPPGGWGLRGPPPPGWDPQAPPYPDWGPRGHLPPDWDPRGPPPPGWGRYPDDWVPPPDWERPPNWRGWGPEGPPEPWAPPGPLPPVPPPGVPLPGPVGMPPPDPAAVPPVPPPGCVPPFAFPPFPAALTREDLEKFQFNFNVFFGNPKKGHAVATDVKVAPGGTEDVDPEIYEAVVSQYPGQVYVTLGMVQTNLSFERKDSTVTLLKGDQVLINVLNDIITERRRATNIKPKIPTTFSSTREIREKGVIMSLKENEGVIKSEEHGELLFELRENLSDIDFTEEDVNEEVEFTVIMVRMKRKVFDVQTENQSAEQVEVKKEEVLKAERVEVKKEEDSGRETGRLVMTINGQQKQLPFGPNDLLTMATMLVGDKVRFSLATHQETKEEHATFVEILPDSFEESIEQRHHGIVIEFSEESGLIKCSENPQLFFRMSEVIERKKLELNEKVEFSIVPHEGGRQAIRIKRFTEKVFLPVRKIGGIGASKAKVSSSWLFSFVGRHVNVLFLETLVKSLRNDHSATRTRYRRSRSRSRSRSPSRTKDRSKSRSPSRDQFGRVVKKRSSSSRERDRSSSRHRRSRDRSYRSTRSRSRSHSRSPRRDRAKSKDGASKKRSRSSREREEGHRKRRELSPSPRRGGVVDSELARKKRELEELNEMIAYKKSLVEFDPRTQEPGGRTCIDYDHGRITLPRPILKKRPEESEYHRPPYSDPYYDRPYGPYPGRHYGGPYSGPYAHPYSDGAYGDRPYDGRLYGEPPYGGAPSVSHRYTDRYDVYNEHYDEHFYDPAYRERPPDKPSRSADSRDPSPFSSTSQNPNRSASPATQTAPTPSTFRPPSPIDSPPRSPSPKQRLGSPQQPPPAEKPPLDRFLAMLNKKVVAEKRSEPADDLLPHERALQDGEGFSRILGLPREPPSTALLHEVEDKQPSPKPPSAERADEGAEPYDKIQSLLRSIGLKLTSGEVSKLASQAKENRSKSSSAERESRPGSVETAPPPPPMRSSSLEPSSLEPPSLEPSIRPKPRSVAPPFTVTSAPTLLPFIGQAAASSSLQPPPTPTGAPATTSASGSGQAAMSVTVARCLNLIETVKSLSAQPPAKAAKSVQFSLPSVTLETDDDIKTKQREKVRSAEMISEPKNVWICGHSLVYWAESRAKSPEVGMQLGMDPSKVTIWWKGVQGMTWSQLLPQLHQLKITWPNPDLLIVHLGGNDLSTESPTDLLASVKKDMTSIRSVFPHCLLVWSYILPRRVWRHSPDSHEVDLVRTTVNRRIHNMVSELGGNSVTHENIRCGANTGLYRADGIHLSPKGIDVFNLNLQDFLEKWEQETNSQRS
uniref:Uncharacterized protein n=1 Tax=Cyprinodon variegatus TaxID=28743 RepID=A0A3Q2GFG1_CYPVA